MTTPTIGDNRPPSQIKFAEETASVLSNWLTKVPVVETEDTARDGKLLVDRARLVLQDLEDERTAQTKPLNEQIKIINDQYRSPKTILDKLMATVKGRLDAWVRAEEEKRLKAAEEARRRAEELEIAAREAEEREREAAEDAAVGVESDIGTATKVADAAFSEFQRAEREARRVEKETNVRIGGGFGRALSSRFHETLMVADPYNAISCMGWSPRIIEAILTEARDWRRRHGRLPDGVVSEKERKL